MLKHTRAENTWARAEHAYQHYFKYISEKPDRFALSFTDLVYVKNFKGGSAVIAEPLLTLDSKLKRYERALRKAGASPVFRLSLHDCDDKEYARARKRMIAFAKLPLFPVADINGFGVSFASTLFHFYFPNLVPILDRRALNGAAIEGIKVNGSDQVKNLLELYPLLIDYFRDRLRNEPNLTLRTLDRSLFVQELRRPPFKKKDNS
jgi:hypothetical protein